MLRLEQLQAHLARGGMDTPSSPSLAQPVAKSTGKIYRGAAAVSPRTTVSGLRIPLLSRHPCRAAAAAVVGLGFIGSGDDVSGAAIGQATIGEPVQTPFHSGGYASFPERIKLVCGAPCMEE
eukprot:COSAG03_NODE_341_length_8828_cov_77.724940_10_plen_122_part_00